MNFEKSPYPSMQDSSIHFSFCGLIFCENLSDTNVFLDYDMVVLHILFNDASERYFNVWETQILDIQKKDLTSKVTYYHNPHSKSTKIWPYLSQSGSLCVIHALSNENFYVNFR